MAPPVPIRSARFTLVALPVALLATMSSERDGAAPFEWPAWWPDDTDRGHLHVWRARADESDANVVWGPRAIVDQRRQMVGHAGFHRPRRATARSSSDTRSFRSTGGAALPRRS